jgi:hypothetical protein
MVCPWHITVLNLSLSDSGLKVDVPHGRRKGLVSLALVEQIEKRMLRNSAAVVVDRCILQRPVY